MGRKNDRDVTAEVPSYRRMLLHLTPDRDSASIYFTQELDLSRTLPYLQQASEKAGQKLSFLHLFVAVAGRMLHEHPRLNRYVCGWRLYQRNDVTITLSVKKELVDGARIVMLKVPIEKGEDLFQVAEKIRTRVQEGRGNRALPVEKEMDFFLRLPGWILNLFVRLVLWLESHHLLPAFFVDPDPMFTSLVVANLGSVGLNAAYHHLYEYGNSPFFAVIGRIQEKPVVVDGKLEIRPTVEVRYTFDERIEDGLACALALAGLKELIEDPERWEQGATDTHGKPPPKV